ncbi:uncharacterized protein [Lolium perenne]|uniref:uncharacterized protein n=1 Tax=Lolium perenne TaxID=4522 RepID=UPI0021F64B28|nr:uncharacterized protein LOC127341571 [Lolium perenne]
MADDEAAIAPAEESLTMPLLEPAASPRDPYVEVRLYRRGAGPAKVFRSGLKGPRRDRLDVRGIQAYHGLRALFAFKPEASRRGRGLRIRPDPATGHSALPFRDGAAIVLDGEPKTSWTKPVSMIAAGLLVTAVMASVALDGVPEWLRSSTVANALFAPWILASVVIIFVRIRTRPRAPP